MEKYYNNKAFQKLTDKLMKPTGKSDTIAGELIRAVNRICYRYYNDGDIIGYGYGNETCNAAGRYILAFGNKGMCDVLKVMWDQNIHDTYDMYDNMNDELYELLLSRLVEETVMYINSGEDGLSKKPEDMLDYDSPEDEKYDMEEEEDW